MLIQQIPASHKVLLRSFLSALLMLSGTFAAAQNVDTLSLIQQMVSRDSLASYPGVTVGMASSKDPYAKAFQFYSDNDGGNFLRDQVTNGRVEHVMLDVSGPGALTRLAVLGPSFAGHTIRFYLDGSTTPAIESDLNTLMTGGSFVKSPLVFAAGPPSLPTGAGSPPPPPGYDLYLPIPFASHALVTYDGPENGNVDGAPASPPLDYVMEYQIFPAGTAVTTFSQSEYASQLSQINTALSSMSAVLPAPPNATPGTQTNLQYSDSNAVTILSGTIPAGGSMTQSLASGSHAIRFLQLNAGTGIPSTSGLVLSMTFDGEQTISTKVGGLFGSGTGLNAANAQTGYNPPSTNSGTTRMQSAGSDGSLVSLWTMPYQSSASVTLKNTTSSPITVTLKADVGTWTWNASSMHFHAYERVVGPVLTSTQETAKFLDVKGTGLYVGDVETSTSAQDPNDTCYNWWGEGDELFYIDGGVGPTLRGTGTEDYFGYAYGHTYFFQSPWVSQVATPDQYPRVPNSFQYDGVTVLNRERLLDGIAFSTRLRFEFEIDDHDQLPPCSGQGTAGTRGSGLQIDHTALFYAIPGATVYPDGVASGSTYTIASKVAGFNLTTDDAGNLSEDAPVDDGTQRFTFQNISGSTYKIQNTATGLYVGSSGSSAGNLLTLAPYANACSQNWTVALYQYAQSATPLNLPTPGNDQYYTLTNGCGLAMDVVNGSKNSEAKVQQYTATGSDSQQWHFTVKLADALYPLGNGIYNLINASSGLALDVPNASTAPGQAMQIYQANGSASQAWSVNALDGGFYSIRNAHGGLALDDGGSSGDDAPIVQSVWGNSPGERWRIVPYGNNGAFELINTDNAERFVLGVGYNSVSNGGPVQQQEAGEGTQHAWVFKPIEVTASSQQNGTYVLVNAKSNQALDVPNASKVNGAALQEYPLDGTAAQAWTVTRLLDGSYSVLNLNSGLALDNEGATNPGNALDQYTWSNGSNQWWRVIGSSGGSSEIINAANSFLMANSNSGTPSAPSCTGTLLDQEQLTGGVATACQKWSLQQAGPSPAASTSPAMPPGTTDTGLVTQTAAPVPCGVEGQTCTFNGPALVSYGTNASLSGGNGTYYSQAAVNSFPCKYQAFGGDPDPGVPKTCWYTALPSAVPDGVYAISNQGSRLPMDLVNASPLNGALIQQYTDNGGSAQQWQIRNQGFGFYSIINMGSGRALDSYGAGGENQQLHQYLWLDTPSQLWQILPNIDGSYTFISQATPGYTLQVSGGAGAAVQQLAAAAGSAQNWNLQPFPLSSVTGTPPVQPGIYTLINRNSHLALDVRGGSNVSGTVIQQFTPSELANQQWALAQLPNGSYTFRNINTQLLLDDAGITAGNQGPPAIGTSMTYPYSSSQQWTLARNTDGSFTVMSVDDKLVLGVSNAGTDPGTATSMYTSDSAADQGWLLQAAPVRLPTGRYTIRNANSGLLLDVTGGGTADGTPVQQYAADGTTAQQWTVTYVTNSNDLYVIAAASSNEAVGTAGAVSSGVQVVLAAEGNSDTRWNIVANNDGSFTITNPGNGFALNAASDSTTTGPVVQELPRASGSQSWIFQPLP